MQVGGCRVPEMFHVERLQRLNRPLDMFHVKLVEAWLGPDQTTNALVDAVVYENRAADQC